MIEFSIYLENPVLVINRYVLLIICLYETKQLIKFKLNSIELKKLTILKKKLTLTKKPLFHFIFVYFEIRS